MILLENAHRNSIKQIINLLNKNLLKCYLLIKNVIIRDEIK